MGPYESQVCAALEAVRVRPPAGISWRGRRSATAPPDIRRVLEGDAARRLLHRELQWIFYSDFYCTGGVEGPVLCPHTPPALTQPFAEALTRANCGRGCWDPGWSLAAGAREPSVRRDGLELRLGDVEWRSAPGAAPDGVEVRLPKELPGILPGYYLALGDVPLRSGHEAPGVRVYWNVTAPAAIRLVLQLTRVLNRERIPFRLKVLTDLICFRRCDSAVLYLHAGDIHHVLPLLGTIYDRLDGGVLPRTPALTRRLAPGLAVVESPPGNESFGMHRCSRLASGVLDERFSRARSIAHRLAIVAERLRTDGIEIDRPYAAPGSGLLDAVALPGRDRPRRGSLRRLTRIGVDRSAFLDAARRIGVSLVERAIWADDRCTWIGVDGPFDPRSPSGGPAGYSALGSDFYDGTSGVAVFLAELAATTGDAKIATTALGAARHALSHAAGEDRSTGGLYTGAMSAAFGAACAGVLLGDAGIVDAARNQAHTFQPSGPDCDLLSGLAGAEVGLFALAGLLGDPGLHELAASTARTLLCRADRGEHGLSWRSSAAKGAVNLLGFSHGAAGIGYALIEAFVATGEPAYRAAALDAFSYERAWFDPVSRNWPTLLRVRSTITPKRARRLRPLSYWCHGAPGVALARLRAHEILGLAELEKEARIALDTTTAALEAIEDVRLENFSLCHGLAGLASVLLEGCASLSNPDRGWHDLAHRVARAGLEVHGSPDDWLCGTRAHGAPGLMVGIAGIGMFYLRLYDESAPSVLIVRPRELAAKRSALHLC